MNHTSRFIGVSYWHYVCFARSRFSCNIHFIYNVWPVQSLQFRMRTSVDLLRWWTEVSLDMKPVPEVQFMLLSSWTIAVLFFGSGNAWTHREVTTHISNRGRVNNSSGRQKSTLTSDDILQIGTTRNERQQYMEINRTSFSPSRIYLRRTSATFRLFHEYFNEWT